MNWIEIIRSLVRPFVVVSLISVILAMAIILTLEYGSAELADKYSVFILTGGSIIVGFLFGERCSRSK